MRWGGSPPEPSCATMYRPTRRDATPGPRAKRTAALTDRVLSMAGGIDRRRDRAGDCARAPIASLTVDPLSTLSKTRDVDLYTSNRLASLVQCLVRSDHWREVAHAGCRECLGSSRGYSGDQETHRATCTTPS